MIRKLYIKIETEGFSILSCICDRKSIEVESSKYYPFQLKNNENTYAINNEVSFEICDKIKLISENYKIYSIIGIIQTESIMIRELDILKRSSQKDLENILNVEMKKFRDFDSRENIILKRKIREVDRDFIKVRVEIFPKRYIEIFKRIEGITKISCEGIYTDYSFAQAICPKCSNNQVQSVLEFRNDDAVYTTVDSRGARESLIIKNESLDMDFIEYIKKFSCIAVMSENEKCSQIIDSLHKFKVIEISKFLEGKEIGGNIDESGEKSILKFAGNRELKKKPHNFYEDSASGEVYKKILCMLCVIAAAIMMSTFRYTLLNRNLAHELDLAMQEKIAMHSDSGDRHVKGYKNIYGTDAEIIAKEINLYPGMVHSVSADKKIIEIEFVSDNREKLEKILENSLNKNAEVEYIKKESVSREEARNTYGIGEKNEKSNKETGQKENNKEKTEEKSNQSNQREAFKESYKKEGLKTCQKGEDKESYKDKKWQQNNNKESCKICRREKEGKKDEKNKKFIKSFLYKNVIAAAEAEENFEEIPDENGENRNSEEGEIRKKQGERQNLKSNNEESKNQNSEVKNSSKKDKNSKDKDGEKTENKPEKNTDSKTEDSSLIDIYFLKIKIHT